MGDYRIRIGFAGSGPYRLAADYGPYTLSGQAATLTYSQLPQEYDFYISTDGTGTAADGGTFADPWPITMLNNATARTRYAGNSVGIKDGTYNVYDALIALGADYDGSVFLVASGTTGNPTVIAAVNPRAAIFSGKSGSNYGNADGAPTIFGVSEAGHVTFDGLHLTGTNRWGIRAGIPYDPNRTRVPGITVKNCEFSDFDARNLAYKFPAQGVNISCLELNQCTGWLVQNNYFHDCIGWELGNADHQSAIESWQCILGICEYNTSELAGSFDGKLGGANGNRFRRNYMDCTHVPTGFNGCFRAWGSDTQAPVWGVEEDFFHNNICIGTSGIVFQDYGGPVEYTHHPVSVYNNTIIVLSGGAASFGFLGRVEPSSFKFYNNIITSAATGDQSFVAVNINSNGLFDYNSYYRSSGTSAWQTYPTHTHATTNLRADASPLSAFRTAMGTNSVGGGEAEANSTSGVNPTFVASGSRALYYQLSIDSSLRASGGNPGKSDGTTGGTNVERGAWGGIEAIDFIGFDPSVRM